MTDFKKLAIEIKCKVEKGNQNFFTIIDKLEDEINYEYHNENYCFETGLCDIIVEMEGGVKIHLGRDFFV